MSLDGHDFGMKTFPEPPGKFPEYVTTLKKFFRSLPEGGSQRGWIRRASSASGNGPVTKERLFSPLGQKNLPSVLILPTKD